MEQFLRDGKWLTLQQLWDYNEKKKQEVVVETPQEVFTETPQVEITQTSKVEITAIPTNQETTGQTPILETKPTKKKKYVANKRKK